MATRSDTIHHQVCPLCEASCGLLIRTENGRIASISGNRNDPHSKGHICPKGVALQDLYDDPDRILEPMVRRGRDWEPVSWERALDLAAERLYAIRRQYGADAVAIYNGNPAAHNIGAASHMKPLVVGLGTRNIYSSASVDVFPNFLVGSLMYGHAFYQPVPDLDHTDFLLMLGANPLVSNGSLMTVAGVGDQLQALRRRGGSLVVIDPRRTETAKVADRHHFIVPATDAVLLLAMVHVLFRDGLADCGHLTDLVDGIDVVREATLPFTPERAAGITGIAAETIVALTHEFARARGAACYGRIGLSVQKFGSLAHWAIQLLNLLTGNLDRVGGALLAQPAVTRYVNPETGSQPGRWRTRVSNFAELWGMFPVAALADEILTPGEGQVRGLLVFAGNPASSVPDVTRMEQALASLDFQVAIDLYLNETSRHADVFLPGTSPLERANYPMFSATFATRNYAKFSPALFEPRGNVLPDWQILDGLARRLAALAGAPPPPVWTPEEMIVEELSTGFHPDTTLQALLDHPDGIDLGPLQPSLVGRLLTPNGRIQAAPPLLVDDVKRLLAEPFSRDQMLLIGRRSVRSNNSWMHNSPRLMAKRPDHHLWVHPDDLARLGVSENDEVVLATSVGEVVVVAKANDDLMPGTICLPHGWGHDQEGMRMRVASALPGANFNLLVDHELLDQPSAGSVVQGIPVVVRSLHG